MRKFKKDYNLKILFIILIMAFSWIDFSYPMSALRVPIDTSKTKKRISKYVNPESLSENLPGMPNIIDRKKKKIVLKEGGIVAAYKSYSITTGEDHITSCCLCIIKNIKTGHYAAAHIMGRVLAPQQPNYKYRLPKKAVPKMTSFLKALDPDMKRRDLVAVIIGGGSQGEPMQELALENFNNVKQSLKEEGISVIAEEPVSEYKKLFRFSGTGKVHIAHLERFRFSIHDPIQPIESRFLGDKNIGSFKTEIDTIEEVYIFSVTKETTLSFPELVPENASARENTEAIGYSKRIRTRL